MDEPHQIGMIYLDMIRTLYPSLSITHNIHHSSYITILDRSNQAVCGSAGHHPRASLSVKGKARSSVRSPLSSSSRPCESRKQRTRQLRSSLFTCKWIQHSERGFKVGRISLGNAAGTSQCSAEHTERMIGPRLNRMEGGGVKISWCEIIGLYI